MKRLCLLDKEEGWMKNRIKAIVLIAVMVLGTLMTKTAEKKVEASEGTLLPMHAIGLDGEYDNSALIPIKNGYYRVIEGAEGKVWVEKYDKDFNIIERNELSKELDKYGGCYAGKDAIYLLFCSRTIKKNDEEAIRIVKFDKNWGRIATAKITGRNDLNINISSGKYQDADPKIVESDGTLYVSCRFYIENVGKRNCIFSVDERNMVGRLIDVSNIDIEKIEYVRNQGPYSQMLAVKKGDVYIAEKGEGYFDINLTRIKNESRNKGITIYDFDGSSYFDYPWDISYSTVNDIEASGENILCVGTTNGWTDMTRNKNGYYYPFSVFLTVTSIGDIGKGETVVKRMTSEEDFSWVTDYRSVFLTKINNDRFFLCYGNQESVDPYNNECNNNKQSVIKYQFVDGYGNTIGKEKTIKAPYIACKPFYKDGKVVFYSAGYTALSFFAIDVENGNVSSKTYNLAGNNAVWDYDNGILSIEGEGAVSSHFAGYFWSDMETHDNSHDDTLGDIRNNIKTIIVKKGIDSISNNAFNYLNNLGEVIIEDGVKSIESCVFLMDHNLKKVFIPDSVTSIDDTAFTESSYEGYFTDFGNSLTIACYKGSYAEEYAQKKGFKIEYLKYEDVAKTTYNGVEGWYYFNKGEVDTSFTGLKSNNSGWWYIKDGKVDFNFTGFATNSNGTWYCKNGKVQFDAKGLIKNPVNGKWYNVKGGQVVKKSDIVSNNNGWWYVDKSGVVDFSFTGLAKNSNGWWYLKNGKVDFSYTGIAKNDNGWWRVKNGKVDFTYTGVAKNEYGWWALENGKVNFNFTGFAKNENGWWYCKNGQVDFNKKDVISGKVNGQSGWWFVSGGKVQMINSVEKNSNGWWCIQNGKVNFSFTGIAKNSLGSWYCKGGKVQFNYSGSVQYNGKTYNVKNGKVVN